MSATLSNYILCFTVYDYNNQLYISDETNQFSATDYLLTTVSSTGLITLFPVVAFFDMPSQSRTFIKVI